MIAAICIDDNNGMMFNKRRLSQDREIINDLIRNFGKHRIFTNNFSSILFEDYNDKVIIDDNLMSVAKKNDVCFIENIEINKYSDKINGIILYRWNRKYPSDMKLNMNLSNFKLDTQYDFKGNSHDKITREVYIKC